MDHWDFDADRDLTPPEGEADVASGDDSTQEDSSSVPGEWPDGDSGIGYAPGLGPDHSDDVSGSGSAVVPEGRATSELPGSQAWAPNGPLVLTVDGVTTNLGIPTLDFDGNGVPDSTLIQGTDGRVYLVGDVSGDGLADGMIIADESGQLVAGFDIQDGVPTPFDVPAGMTMSQVLAQIGTAEGQGAITPIDPSTGQDPVPSGSSLPATDGESPIEAVASTDLGSPGGHVVLDNGGTLIDLGPATEDFDNDGRLESVVIKDEQGRPTYVVSEMTTSGEIDDLYILDPATGAVVHHFTVTGGAVTGNDSGAAVADPPAGTSTGAVDGSADPAETVGLAPENSPAATGGPEKIIAPGGYSGDGAIQGVYYQMTQNMYDVASQVWFDLTDGEPYPRSAGGAPLNPGEVFAQLGDRPDVSAEDKDELKQMAETWNHSIQVA